jgi:hypothetical protein
MLNPDVFSTMLRWISRYFHLFGRHQREGYDVTKPKEGFSLLNRKKLCPCPFHTHGPKDAHKDHEKCAVPFKNCGHEDEDLSGEVTVELDQRMSELLAALMRGPPNL